MALRRAPLLLACVIACGTAGATGNEPVTVNFIDPDSRIAHAVLTFDAGRDGKLTLLPRWCGFDSRHCPVGELPVPSSFSRFFDREIKEPVIIEVSADVTIQLNPVVGIDARLMTKGPNGQDLFRTLDLLQGENRAIAPLPEAQAARTINFRSEQEGAEVVRVLIADNENYVPEDRVGYGSMVALPAGWCGASPSECPGFSFEANGDLLQKWVSEQTSEAEPALWFFDEFEIQLLRNGTQLAMIVDQYAGSTLAHSQRFEMDLENTALGEAPSALDCSPLSEPLIGSVDYHIFRETDGVCIGTLGWAVVPDPIATLDLAAGWCGRPDCDAIEVTSDSFAQEKFPSRFWEGQTNGPSVTLMAGDDGWAAPVGLFAADGRVLVRIKSQWAKAQTNSEPATLTGKAYNIDALPGPAGIYALIEGKADLDGLGNIGDNLCLFNPVIYAGRGQTWFKELGAPVGGNPYKFTRWMKCSRFDDGPENCVMHEGEPGTPNPVGATSGFNYTPIGDGHFKACDNSDDTQCALLYACIGDDKALTYDREFATGGNMAEAILSDPQGRSPGFRYIDNQTIQFEE